MNHEKYLLTQDYLHQNMISQRETAEMFSIEINKIRF